jgi:anti-anti-sigma factor
MLNLPELADSTYSGVGLKLAGKSGERLTLALRGRLIANTTEDLARRVVTICAREKWAREVVLDFKQVAQIDSIGIGVICEIHSQVAEHGAGLRIVNGSPMVLKVLRLMSVDSFIELD